MESRLCVLDHDGGDVTPLTTFNSGPGDWASGGRRIALAGVGPSSYEMFIVTAEGSGVVNLTRESLLDTGPVWAP